MQCSRQPRLWFDPEQRQRLAVGYGGDETSKITGVDKALYEWNQMKYRNQWGTALVMLLLGGCPGFSDEPGKDKIKADLVEREVCGWFINSISEFRELGINRRVGNSEIAEYDLHFELERRQKDRIIDAHAVYKKHGENWVLSSFSARNCKSTEEIARAKEEQKRQARVEAERKAKNRTGAEKREESGSGLNAEEERKLPQRRADAEFGRYAKRIQERVENNWRYSGRRCRTARVLVQLAVGGVVRDVRTIRGSGDPVFDRSVEAAILRASPLPLPPDPELSPFYREMEFLFNPCGQEIN